MSDNEIRAKTEALLFGLGRPLSFVELEKLLGVPRSEILRALGEKRDAAGVVLVEDGESVELRASGEGAPLIEKARREELSREVGRAGLEVLSAVLYRGPLTRAEIDFIRGVNSSQTIRTLAMRGLIRKSQNPRDERSYLYEPTTELLAWLGLTSRVELRDYEEVRGRLKELEEEYRNKEKETV
jgi:segregation and condensation protein B